MCCRRMFAMMQHLRHFCQVFIEELWQVMTRSAVKSSALDRNSEGRRLKIGEWRRLELRTPCEKFLATPLGSSAMVRTSQQGAVELAMGRNRGDANNVIIQKNSLPWRQSVMKTGPNSFPLPSLPSLLFPISLPLPCLWK